MVNDITDVPIEQLYSHPVVQQLLSQIESTDLEKDVKLPYVIKNKTLMSPGVWNGYYYSPDAISQAFINSHWDKKEIRSLFLDHEDLNAHEWIGEVKNARLVGEDVVGDLVVVDKPTAMKLAYGAKMGISPKVSGGEEDGKMLNFTFDNFSVVINPAVKTAYINNSENKKDVKMAKWDTAYVNDLPDSAFMWIESGGEKDADGKTVPRSLRHLPVKDKDGKWDLPHVRNALARLNQVKGLPKTKADEIRKELEGVLEAAKEGGKKMAEEEQKPEETPTQEDSGKMPEEEVVETASDVINAFSKLGVEIAMKAQELMEKDKDMKCMAAIEMAAKALQEVVEEEPKKEEAPVEDEMQAKELSKEEKNQILRKALQILNSEEEKPEEKEEVSEEPKAEEEKPEVEEEEKVEEKKEENKVQNEMSQMIEQQRKVIQTLSEKLESVERKLNEPDKMSVKSEELSQSLNQDPDAAFMSALMNM